MIKKTCAFLTYIILTSCTSEDLNEKKARILIDSFHHGVINHDFALIYESASHDFQKIIDKNEFSLMLSSIQDKLGTPDKYTIIKTLDAKHDLGYFIFSARVLTHYEHGDAVETFSFKGEKGDGGLIYYHIDSERLKELEDIFGSEK